MRNARRMASETLFNAAGLSLVLGIVVAAVPELVGLAILLVILCAVCLVMSMLYSV